MQQVQQEQEQQEQHAPEEEPQLLWWNMIWCRDAPMPVPPPPSPHHKGVVQKSGDPCMSTAEEHGSLCQQQEQRSYWGRWSAAAGTCPTRASSCRRRSRVRNSRSRDPCVNSI